MSEPLDKSNAPIDPDNFCFVLDGFTFRMDAGQLFTDNKGVWTEHYAFEYTGPPLYALARAWAAHQDRIAAANEIYAVRRECP
jgi:hypothetical protein